MRILVLSDIHREYWKERDQRPRFDLTISRPDVVVLAGDIDKDAQAIPWANEAFAGVPVVYVHGNHEGYGEKLEKMQHRLRESAAATNGHVHLLERNEVTIDGVRFLGCTLWTNFRLHGDARYTFDRYECGTKINDYKSIRVASQGYRKLQTRDTEGIHHRSVKWLRERLEAPGQAGRTVVVTHMAPSARSVPPQYKNNPIAAAYASDLEDLVVQADLWIHGHMHDSVDYMIRDTRVVANPRGYPVRAKFQGYVEAGLVPENDDFNPNFIVEI